MGIEPDGIEDVDFRRRFNESYSPLSFKLTFIINRLFGSKLTHGVTFGKDSRLPTYNFWRYNLSKHVDKISYALNMKKVKLNFEGYDEMVYGLFHDGNRKLSKLTGIDVFKYKYV